MVTGSKALMARATSTKAFWAGFAPSRQVSGRSGQIIQIFSWGSNSPGMRKPSFLGVLRMRFAMVFFRSFQGVLPLFYTSAAPGTRPDRRRGEIFSKRGLLFVPRRCRMKKICKGGPPS